MKKTFKMSIRVKGTEQIFADGLEPGVIATQEVEYNLDPSDYEKSTFLVSLINKQEEMLKKNVEVFMEEV